MMLREELSLTLLMMVLLVADPQLNSWSCWLTLSRFTTFFLDAVVNITCPGAGALNTDFLSIDSSCLGLDRKHMVASCQQCSATAPCTA